MIRKFLFTPILLLYCATLVFAAWDRSFLPIRLKRSQSVAIEALLVIGVMPGLRVFGGPRDRLEALVRARCTVVDGVDAQGRRTRIYPTESCPPSGLRWKPVVYEHMIMHWTSWLRHGDFVSNLSALGDHFCQKSNNPDFTHVEVRQDLPLTHYVTGKKSTQSERFGRVECRR